VRESDEVLGRDSALEHRRRLLRGGPGMISSRHGKPHEQLLRRERDVQEEPDPDVGAQRAHHLRHEVQCSRAHHHGPAVAAVGERPLRSAG
jgi:hypothetical protein